jgi:hypothetical protein
VSVPSRSTAPPVLRALDRISADLDELVGDPQIADEEQAKVEDPRPGASATEAVERPGRTGGLMGRSGPSTSRAEGTRQWGNRDETIPVSGRSWKRSVK